MRTTTNQSIQIISVGMHNHLSGPDFFNAKLSIDNQLWAGNVELHLKSSDWYAHNHETDANYDNVILHVVWEDDASVFRKDNTEIPTLELKNVIPLHILNNYKELFNNKDNKFINCEKDIASVDKFEIQNWLERLYFERLEQKSEVIFKMLRESQNNWEQVLFSLLMKNFGSKVNGASFLELSQSIGFNVFKKICLAPQEAESILFGCSRLLETNEISDAYYLDLQKEFKFQKSKFELENATIKKPEFFRLRPTNFPTIRLSQIASLYAKHKTLFGRIMECVTLKEIYELFNVSASLYWDNHYTFGKISKKSKKRLTKSFINLIVINTILPLRFCYAKHRGNEENDIILELISSLSKEKNGIVDNFQHLKLQIENAKESQAVLQLYNEYCTKNKCLQCVIGSNLLSKNG